MTHQQLVKYGARWARRKYSVVCTEVCGQTSEEPDVLAWRRRGVDRMESAVLEAKASRADFLADQNKGFRISKREGMGNFRYYIVPQGLVEGHELPPGWGLLEVGPRGGVRQAQYSIDFGYRNIEAESCILVSLVRRLGATPGRAVSVKAYVYDSAGKTTLGVEE